MEGTFKKSTSGGPDRWSFKPFSNGVIKQNSRVDLSCYIHLITNGRWGCGQGWVTQNSPPFEQHLWTQDNIARHSRMLIFQGNVVTSHKQKQMSSLGFDSCLSGAGGWTGWRKETDFWSRCLFDLFGHLPVLLWALFAPTAYQCLELYAAHYAAFGHNAGHCP